MAKSKPSAPGEEKTISIYQSRKLRLRIMPPNRGLIEIVNSADHGRVCMLRVADFLSINDAQAYAELIRLAPVLLDEYLSDGKRMTQVLRRLTQKMAQGRGKINAPV